METVTLGVTTYGGVDLLLSCLQSIQKSIRDRGYSNLEVVIVDDGTPETGEREKLEFVSHAHNAKYVRFEEQKGNVVRYNTIVDCSKGDVVFLIDNDVVIPDRWFWSALYFLTANKMRIDPARKGVFKGAGVASFLSQKITAHGVNELLNKRRIPAIGSGRVPERATELAGYCFGFTREAYHLVGGFDSENFKYFMGDSDFCCRLAEKGLMSYRLLYPVVYHREHVTYDSYPELEAWERVKQDLANFLKKWGCYPKEMEEKLLFQTTPQRVKWYANYAHYEDWDVEEKRDFKDYRPLVEEVSEVEGGYRDSDL